MYQAILADDVQTVSSLIESGEFKDMCITKVNSDSPAIMNQNPPLICVAAYFGASKCLQYFLENGFDLFTPDKVFIFTYKVIIILFMVFFFCIYRLPTHFAAAGGQDGILPFLDDNCADFKAFDSVSF